MLLTNTINAATTIETILAGNACMCVIELRGRSADFVQFADWQPAHRRAKRSMRTSGRPAAGVIRPNDLPGYSSDLVSHRSLRSVLGCVTVG
ncbi:MAG: hypothetical protein ABGZ35_31230 [Planctomycetaceae bacterium]|jgi:hypothetical protein